MSKIAQAWRRLVGRFSVAFLLMFGAVGIAGAAGFVLVLTQNPGGQVLFQGNVEYFGPLTDGSSYKIYTSAAAAAADGATSGGIIQIGSSFSTAGLCGGTVPAGTCASYTTLNPVSNLGVLLPTNPFYQPNQGSFTYNSATTDPTLTDISFGFTTQGGFSYYFEANGASPGGYDFHGAGIISGAGDETVYSATAGGDPIFYANGSAPEMDGNMVPKVALMLGGLYFLARARNLKRAEG
jgi:hypothetical protein